jgi:hypothetical protein
MDLVPVGSGWSGYPLRPRKAARSNVCSAKGRWIVSNRRYAVHLRFRIARDTAERPLFYRFMGPQTDGIVDMSILLPHRTVSVSNLNP